METRKRILIVDDEPQIGKIFGLQLRLAGYDVTCTTSGADAIEMVRSREFDMMLLDILMPGVTGLEVLKEVRKFSQIPTLVFTAMQDAPDLAEKMGANDSISKPLNPNYLVEKISSMLNNQPRPQF